MATKKNSIPSKYKRGFIQSLDGRTGIAQEMRDRYTAMTNDLGGVNNLSYAQRSLVERSLWLEYFISVQEAALALGLNESFDVGQWIQASNAIQGIYSKLGLQRVAKQAPGISELIKRNNQGASV